jgi:cytochrome P450 PksS
MSLFSLRSAKDQESPRPAISLASPEFKANPFSFYAALRAEAPISRTLLPTREPAWLITRYDDAVAVLKDDRFVKNAANVLTPAQRARRPWFRRRFKLLQRQMLSTDGPEHTRLRALVSQAFTPRLIEPMRDRIQALADQLLDRVQAKGRFDLIRDFALPLPSIVIAEMLGVPAGDRHAFHRWSNALMAAAHSTGHMLYALPNILLFLRYLRKFIRKRQIDPQHDLVSALVQAEVAGERLSEDELVAMLVLLLVAGHETTVNLIGNGMLALLEHPEQMDILRQDPGLIRSAVEELLRFTSPVDLATERYPREEVTLGGVAIPRGEMVFVALTSANRDERQFPNPDTLDLTREPNKHLSFGLAFLPWGTTRPVGRTAGHQYPVAPAARASTDGGARSFALAARLTLTRTGDAAGGVWWQGAKGGISRAGVAPIRAERR